MKKTLSTIAAALFAVTIGTADIACTRPEPRTADDIDDERVARVIDAREHRIRESLDDIARSVRCVRTRTTYAPRDNPAGPVRVRRSHGTAFAYERRDGYTYMVTNVHVMEDPEEVVIPDISVEGGSLVINRVTYRRVGSSIGTLVDNGSDDDSSDDIPVEVVARNPDLDIAVIRTRHDLHISDRFIRDDGFSPEINDELYVIGFPQGWQRTVTRGSVANPYHVDDGEDLNIMDVTATYGNSGSPYFIRRGEDLFWAGTMGQGRLYNDLSRVTLFILGTPIRAFYDMLDADEPMDLDFTAGSMLRTRIRLFRSDDPAGDLSAPESYSYEEVEE